jgi:hypothetical protein
MTPSKESLNAAREIRAQLGIACEAAPLATLIDTAYAEHRERVKRLVRAAEKAMREIADPEDTDLPAALAALKEPHDPVA